MWGTTADTVSCAQHLQALWIMIVTHPQSLSCIALWPLLLLCQVLKSTLSRWIDGVYVSVLAT